MGILSREKAIRGWDVIVSGLRVKGER